MLFEASLRILSSHLNSKLGACIIPIFDKTSLLRFFKGILTFRQNYLHNVTTLINLHLILNFKTLFDDLTWQNGSKICRLYSKNDQINYKRP